MANEMDQFKNMPKEPQLSDKENLEESNRKNQEEEKKASLTIESTKEGTQDLLGRLNPNEKEDIARIKAMEASDNNEINFDIGFDDIEDALGSGELDIAKISFDNKNDGELVGGEETQEKENTVNEKEEKQNAERFKENTYSPLLEELNNLGYITLDQDIITKVINNNANEIPAIITEICSNISDNDVKTNILDHLEGNNEVVTSDTFEKSEFYSYSNELDIDLDSGVGGLELMLANEFFTLPKKDGESNSEVDILRTMDTVSKIVVNKNNSDFRLNNSELISEIGKEVNPSKKYAMLKDLFKEDLITDAKFGGSKGKTEIAMKQKSIKNKAKKNTEATEQIIALNNKNLSEKEIKILAEEKNNLIAEANDLDHFEGEIFNAGEQDVLNDNLKGSDEIV